MCKWEFINASVIGKSHIESGTECQDFCRVDIIKDINGNEYLIIAVSDGAGSAALSSIGAEQTCKYFFRECKELICTPDDLIKTFTENDAKTLVSRLKIELENLADQLNVSPKDLSCTLVAAIISDDISVFIQIGDGGIVVSHPEGYKLVFWPEQGEYANITWFVTSEDVLDHVMFKKLDYPIFHISVFTDGIQNIALDYSNKTAYSLFFKPIFSQTVKKLLSMPRKERLLYLEKFLNSKRINERTDDDKSLVLAVRLKGKDEDSFQ